MSQTSTKRRFHPIAGLICRLRRQPNTCAWGLTKSKKVRMAFWVLSYYWLREAINGPSLCFCGLFPNVRQYFCKTVFLFICPWKTRLIRSSIMLHEVLLFHGICIFWYITFFVSLGKDNLNNVVFFGFKLSNSSRTVYSPASYLYTDHRLQAPFSSALFLWGMLFAHEWWGRTDSEDF